MNTTSKNYETALFKTIQDWEKWLDTNHPTTPGIWLKFAKKNSGEESIHYPEALDVALCFGWIDGQSKSLNELFYLQKFTPRGKRSIWSKINREKVTRFIAEGRMKPAGQAAIDAAKADGRWEAAYDSPSTMEIPKDFLTRLATDKKAEAFFNTLNKTNTYAIAWRLQTAKKPETREKRMQVILTMLHEETKFH